MAVPLLLAIPRRALIMAMVATANQPIYSMPNGAPVAVRIIPAVAVHRLCSMPGGQMKKSQANADSLCDKASRVAGRQQRVMLCRADYLHWLCFFHLSSQTPHVAAEKKQLHTMLDIQR